MLFLGAVEVDLLAGRACGGSMPPHSIFRVLGCGLVISDAECGGQCVSQMRQGCSNRGVFRVERGSNRGVSSAFRVEA